MKKLALLALLVTLSLPASAMQPVIYLGQPYLDAGGEAWWVPVNIIRNDEDSLFVMKTPDGDSMANLFMTGTLTAVLDPSNNPHLGFGYTQWGDFWDFGGSTIQWDIPYRPHYWIVGGGGLWGSEFGSCVAGPNVGARTMFSFLVRGEGTVSLIAANTLLTKSCDPYNYVNVEVIEAPVSVPPGSTGGGGGGGGTCGGDPNCIEALVVGEEASAKKADVKRTTWGRIKALYR